jgi:hypothetical protein
MSYEPRCTICREPVNLEESKTDEYGQAVHENCYVWTVELKKPRKPIASQPIHDDPSRAQAL